MSEKAVDISPTTNTCCGLDDDGNPPEHCPAAHNRRYYDMQIGDLNTRFDTLHEKLDPVIEIWRDLAGLVKILKYIGVAVAWCVKLSIGIGAAIGINELFTK